MKYEISNQDNYLNYINTNFIKLKATEELSFDYYFKDNLSFSPCIFLLKLSSDP